MLGKTSLIVFSSVNTRTEFWPDWTVSLATLLVDPHIFQISDLLGLVLYLLERGRVINPNRDIKTFSELMLSLLMFWTLFNVDRYG